MSTKIYWKKIFRLKFSQVNPHLENKNFYNIFSFNHMHIRKHSAEQTDSDELKDLMDTTGLNSGNEFIHVKKSIFGVNHTIRSNFYMITLSLLAINFWLLSNYVNWYFLEANIGVSDWMVLVLKRLPNLIEIGSAVLGGFGTTLFFKTVVFDLFEINCGLNDLNIGDFSSSIKKKVETNLLLLIDDGKEPDKLRGEFKISRMRNEKSKF